MSWILDHLVDILDLAWRHAVLAGVPLALGLLLAFPVGWLARRNLALYTQLVVGNGLL